ncbi:MAG: ribonuclease HI family protein [Candidatus Doudnabacteria bacterium]|nr:ribonuclease HI family protein [Candidatus Doudnabacteria bacterium]
MKLIVNTDGGARGNPGPAGIGVVIRNDAEEIIFEHGSYIGEQTNNVAEYSALIKALEAAHDLGGTDVLVRMDSELIVKQMQGLYKIKEPTLQGLAARVVKLKNSFHSVVFAHVRREFNKDADRMVNQALDAELK